MTKPQIWVAAFFVLFILLFLLARVSKNIDQTSSTVTNPIPQADLTSGDLNASELLTKLGCITCHGPDLKGTQMGPALSELSNFWSRDKLINYLRNPSSFMDSDRFKAYKKEYPNVLMPSFGNIDVKDLGKIAEYLLQL